MKIKSVVFSVIISLSIMQPAISQLQNFDLTKYKVTDYKRQGLDFNFKGNGAYLKNKWDLSHNGDPNNYLSKEYNSNIIINYYSELNTRKRQQYFNISGDLTPYNLTTSKNEWTNYSNYQEMRLTNINLNLDFNNKFYRSNNFYFEIGAWSDLHYNYNYIKNKTINNSLITTNKNKEEVTASITNLTIGIGKGRIENIEDARMAVYILEDLYSKNKLSRQPSEDEILEFAAKITQLKSKRFLDSRIRKIYEIQALDSFLRSSKLVSDNDAIYFTSVNDNWNYSNNPVRKYGQSVSLKMIPTYGYTYNFNESSDILRNSKYGVQTFVPQALIEYVNYKPLNLKWQRNILVNVSGGRSWEWADFEYFTDEIYNFLRGSASYEYGYYPNSRTYGTLGVFGTAEKRWEKPKNELNTTTNIYYIGGKLSLYYYVSERLKVSFSGTLSYDLYKSKNDFDSGKTNRIQYYFSVGLTYSLF